MTKRTWGVGREGGWDPDPRDWDRLARAAVRHPGRVLISSESFALTPDESAAQMVADLGPERVHVVFTMRPVAALLSSSWQQYLKSGWTTTYGQWLDQIVAELEPGARRSGFWLRNDYPRSWAAGPGWSGPSGCTWCAWTGPIGGSCCGRSGSCSTCPRESPTSRRRTPTGR